MCKQALMLIGRRDMRGIFLGFSDHSWTTLLKWVHSFDGTIKTPCTAKKSLNFTLRALTFDPPDQHTVILFPLLPWRFCCAFGKRVYCYSTPGLWFICQACWEISFMGMSKLIDQRLGKTPNCTIICTWCYYTP